MPLHVAHFVHRYPPAVGGAEAYFARLGEHFVRSGDAVTVWTSTAVELSEMWARVPLSPGGRGERGEGDGEASHPPPPLRGRSMEPQVPSGGGLDFPTAPPPGSGFALTDLPLKGGGGVTGTADDALPSGSRLRVRRYRPLTFPLRRYVLKALSLLPVRPWQLLTSPSNPVMPDMWRDVRRYAGPLDAVHATAFPYGFPLMCGLRLARRRRVPFLLTPFLHLGDPTDPHDLTRKRYTTPALVWLLKQADRVFVQTPSEFELAAKLGVNRERLVLQGLGVDAGECTGGDRAKARAAWGVSDEMCVVGHLSNNSAEKGTVDLLKATGSPRGNAERRQSVVLAGPAMPSFLQFWQSFPHQEHVTRLGVLSDSAKCDFFAGIDAFCLPSRTDSFGLVLLEAWANGKPVVVYRAGGPADLVRDGVDGFVVKCGDMAELRDRLVRLANDRELARRMGEAGRRRVATDFEWEPKLRQVREAITSSSTSRGPTASWRSR